MNTLAKQIKEIIDPTLPLISNLANVSALLKGLPNINWCGFYLYDNEKLFLGPFQGEPACTVIPLSHGVCGYAARNRQTVIVKDVNEFKDHIACSSLSKSEIVTPIIKDNELKGVIDIDAPIVDRFQKEDAALLEEIADILKELFSWKNSI